MPPGGRPKIGIKIKSLTRPIGSTRVDVGKLMGAAGQMQGFLVGKSLLRSNFSPRTKQTLQELSQGIGDVMRQPRVSVEHYREILRASTSSDGSSGDSRGPVITSIDGSRNSNLPSNVVEIALPFQRTRRRPQTENDIDRLQTLANDWHPSNANNRRLQPNLSHDMNIREIIVQATKLANPNDGIPLVRLVFRDAIQSIDFALSSEVARSNPRLAFELVKMRGALKDKLGCAESDPLFDQIHFLKALRFAPKNPQREEVRDLITRSFTRRVHRLDSESTEALFTRRGVLLELHSRTKEANLDLADVVGLELGRTYEKLGDREMAKKTFWGIVLNPSTETRNPDNILEIPDPVHKAIIALEELTPKLHRKTFYERLFGSSDVRVKVYAAYKNIGAHTSDNALTYMAQLMLESRNVAYRTKTSRKPGELRPFEETIDLFFRMIRQAGIDSVDAARTLFGIGSRSRQLISSEFKTLAETLIERGNPGDSEGPESTE